MCDEKGMKGEGYTLRLAKCHGHYIDTYCKPIPGTCMRKSSLCLCHHHLFVAVILRTTTKIRKGVCGLSRCVAISTVQR